jgi:O-antigen ligase
LPNFHNGYVASLVEIGLIGSFIFLLMAIFLGRGIFRKYAQWKEARSEAALLIAFLLMIIVINFTETFFMRATSGFQAFFFFAFFAVRNASPRPSAQRSGFNDCRVSSSSFER